MNWSISRFKRVIFITLQQQQYYVRRLLCKYGNFERNFAPSIVMLRHTMDICDVRKGLCKPSLYYKLEKELPSYSKTCVKLPLKNRQNEDLDNNWALNEGRKYCRMFHLEHSAIPLACIKR